MFIERLVEAVDVDDVPAVEAALAAGADVNARLGGGDTLLMRAASEGHLAMLQALLRGGADVDAKRDDGMTALMLASFFGHFDVASALLDRGADINAEDTHKFTALRLASSKWHSEVMRLLERAGAVSPAAAPGCAAKESSPRPHAQTEPTHQVREQGEHGGKILLSTKLPIALTASKAGARRPEQCLEVSVPPPGELSSRPVAGPLRARGFRFLAAGACFVVLLLAGLQRTIVRNAKGTAVRPFASTAVAAGEQPVTPLAPPRGEGEAVAVEPVAAANPTPLQRDPTAVNTGKSAAAAEPVKLPKAPARGQHLGEPTVASTALTSTTPSQIESRLPEVKETNTSLPAEQSRGVTVVTTPRDAPRSSTRQGEQPPTVRPPLSSPTPKKKVIPWP